MRDLNQTRLLLLALSSTLALAGCGQQQADQNQGGWHLNDDKNISSNTLTNNGNGQIEEEGPQYQTPSMDVLQGKMQKFPAKYPVVRYPNAQVAMVDVRASRPPGALNMVMLKTIDNIPQVGTFYQQRLQQEQWKKVSEYHNEIYDSTKWEKDNLQCEVRVSQDFSNPNGKRLIQLLYTQKPKKRLFKPFMPPPQQTKQIEQAQTQH